MRLSIYRLFLVIQHLKVCLFRTSYMFEVQKVVAMGSDYFPKLLDMALGISPPFFPSQKPGLSVETSADPHWARVPFQLQVLVRNSGDGRRTLLSYPCFLVRSEEGRDSVHLVLVSMGSTHRGRSLLHKRFLFGFPILSWRRNGVGNADDDAGRGSDVKTRKFLQNDMKKGTIYLKCFLL